MVLTLSGWAQPSGLFVLSLQGESGTKHAPAKERVSRGNSPLLACC